MANLEKTIKIVGDTNLAKLVNAIEKTDAREPLHLEWQTIFAGSEAQPEELLDPKAKDKILHKLDESIFLLRESDARSELFHDMKRRAIRVYLLGQLVEQLLGKRHELVLNNGNRIKITPEAAAVIAFNSKTASNDGVPSILTHQRLS